MWGRVLRATMLAAIIALLIEQPAAAVCPVQQLHDLVRSSDDVWWGTVTDATASPHRGAGVWQLTVRLESVLKGDGAPGDTVSVFRSTCGLFLTHSAAKRAASSFIGDRDLFIVRVDNHGRQVAYSELVDVGGNTNATPNEQYYAALHALGLQPPPGIPTDGGSMSGSGGAVLGLLAAAGLAMIGVLIVVVFFRRQTR